MKHKVFAANKVRLDVYCATFFKDISRSQLQKLISQGQVKLNNKTVNPKTLVKSGDIIEFTKDLTVKPEITEIDIPIIYKDEDCLVLDKPSGLLTHSKGVENIEPTIASFIKKYLKTSSKTNREGIVHRLDRATSGVIICARHPQALNFFQKQFSKRNVKKTYLAVINGQLKIDQAVIDAPIQRHPKNPKLFRTSLTGKSAQTEYKVLQSLNSKQLVELKPFTGRTHQLRVHLKHLGHPILGDDFYGGQKADRLYLHASSLELTLPNGQRRQFNSPLPEQFNKILHEK